MKIGIVSPYAYPRPGGANSYIRETYEELRRLGHEVRIITAPWGDDPPAQDVIQIGRAVAVPYNGSVGRITLSLRLEWLVNRMLEREQFDILHHHEPLVPFLSAQILDRAICPNVATFHSFGGFSMSYWLGRPIGRHYMKKLDARIAVSTAARHFVSRYFPGEYRIIPNGVDVDAYRNARPFPEYRDGKFNILFTGRLEPRKGATYLVRAYAALKKKHPETRLIIVGVGPQLGELRRFVHDQRVGDVLFAGRTTSSGNTFGCSRASRRNPRYAPRTRSSQLPPPEGTSNSPSNTSTIPSSTFINLSQFASRHKRPAWRKRSTSSL